MKMEKFFENWPKDKDNNSVNIDSELKWMQKEILEDYDKLWHLRKQLFYKEQQFNSFFKANAGAFNSISNIRNIVEAYNNGLFFSDKINSKEAQTRIREIVANFFPVWMWKELEFFEFCQEGYDAHGFEFSFIWAHKFGKLKKEVEIRIYLPNPNCIEVGKAFDAFKVWDSMLEIGFDEKAFKTRVYFNDVVKRQKEWRGSTFHNIGSAYMNNEIIDLIDKWAKSYDPSAPKEEDEE